MEVEEWKFFEKSTSDYPLIVLVPIYGLQSFTIEGNTLSSMEGIQLVMKPEEKVWYENISNSGGTKITYKSLEEAKSWAHSEILGQIKITITGNDFKVEKV